MKETFWLFCGEKFIEAVRLNANASLYEIFAKARNNIHILGESCDKMPYLLSCLVYIYRDNEKILIS
jgi:hypothetical protein